MDKRYYNEHILHNMRYQNGEDHCKTENSDGVLVANVGREAYKNNDFRKVFWTGAHLQMTLMSLGRAGEIGVECHVDTDQYIKIERGRALLVIGQAKESMTERKHLYEGESVFIPAGTWHNVINCGRSTLKLSSIYAPPHHPHLI